MQPPFLTLANAGINLGVETEISKECSSACVPIFLAGQKRVLKKGALIGFHRPNWQQDSMERYYDAKKEDFGWNTPFEFSNWVQKDTFEVATQLYDRFSQAGVAPEFISQAFKYDIEQMWYPSVAPTLLFDCLTKPSVPATLDVESALASRLTEASWEAGLKPSSSELELSLISLERLPPKA